MRRPELRGLYAVTPESTDGAALLRQVEAALAGGCRIVQLRDKQSRMSERLARAHALRAATRGECVLPGPFAAWVLDGLERFAAAEPPHAALDRAPSATDTEREVLTCLARGEQPASIAETYDVTTRLVNLHTGFAVAKLQRWTETRRQVSQLA